MADNPLARRQAGALQDPQNIRPPRRRPHQQPQYRPPSKRVDANTRIPRLIHQFRHGLRTSPRLCSTTYLQNRAILVVSWFESSNHANTCSFTRRIHWAAFTYTPASTCRDWTNYSFECAWLYINRVVRDVRDMSTSDCVARIVDGSSARPSGDGSTRLDVYVKYKFGRALIPLF